MWRVQDSKAGIIKQLEYNETARYLGVDFDRRGVKTWNIFGKMNNLLKRISSAPLKPQQKIHLLTAFVQPKIFHRGTFANLCMKDLRKMDMLIRYFVRKWTRLPKDLATAIIHAYIRDGGFGVRSMMTVIPRLRKKRSVQCGTQAVRNHEIEAKRDEDEHWRAKIQNTVDGQHLSIQTNSANTARWVTNGTKLMSGADYVRALKIRSNSIMTKHSRRRYTKVRSNVCDAGCMSQESMNHIVQKCPKTWSARAKRHDEICKFLERILTEKDLKTLREPSFRCGPSKHKSDLVVALKEKAAIIDVTVVSDSDGEGMMAAYRKKREK